MLIRSFTTNIKRTKVMMDSYRYDIVAEMTECVQLLSWLHIIGEMDHCCKCQVDSSNCKMIAVGCNTGRRANGQIIPAEILD